MTERPPRFCPLHGHETRLCWDGCLVERVEFARAGHALQMFWWERKRGVPPFSLATYRCRYGR